MAEPLPETPNPNRACMPQELVSSAAFLLGRVGYSVKMQVVDEFEQVGFSPRHYSVLALLDEDARETQATIADALNLDRSSLVGLLDTLERNGLIERRRDPNDRRRHLVSLTAPGRRQLASFRKLARRVEEEVLAPLDEDDRATLHRLLLQLAAHRDERYIARPAA
jgi:DNA-binding MarR family transcriptional regulator